MSGNNVAIYRHDGQNPEQQFIPTCVCLLLSELVTLGVDLAVRDRRVFNIRAVL